MSHEGCHEGCLCHALNPPKLVVPSELTKCYKCSGCKLSFAAENGQEAMKWHRGQHLKYCPGNGYYARQFKQIGKVPQEIWL